MKKILLTVIFSAAVALSAKAQIITDINFSGTNSSFTGAAVTGSTGDYWNFMSSTPPSAITPGGGNLFGPNGSTDSGLTISWSGGNFPYVPGGGVSLWPNSPTPGITRGITNTNGVTHYTLAGFDPSQTYNFDFLTATDTTGRGTKITLTGAAITSGIATMNKADTTWVNGDEYIQFLNVAPDPSTGNISFVLATAPGSPEGDLNGIQIFQTPQAVPEPGTYAMLGMGLAALFMIRRFRNAIQG